MLFAAVAAAPPVAMYIELCCLLLLLLFHLLPCLLSCAALQYAVSMQHAACSVQYAVRSTQYAVYRLVLNDRNITIKSNSAWHQRMP